MRHKLSGLLACVLLGATSFVVHAHSSNEVVTTDKGVVIGSRTDAGRQFLGIPYAAAPVGALRWKEPQPVARWHKPRVTRQFESSCPQTPSAFGLASLDEDCLYLNVYTPSRSHRAPVMVWFHPGAFQFGEADDYDPRELVARGVVVVFGGSASVLACPMCFGAQETSLVSGTQSGVLALLIILRHRDNLSRLAAGTERQLGG